MLLMLLFIIAAIALFGVGFFAKLAWWVFVVAGVIFIVGLLLGFLQRGRDRGATL